MNWSAFLGAFLGTFAALIAAFAVFAVWMYFDDRRQKSHPSTPNRASSDSGDIAKILERDLERHVIEHFQEYFPGWTILDSPTLSSNGSAPGRKPSGVRYRTEAGEIDILCRDSNNTLVVIELKREKAPDEVVTQTDRYINWVRSHLAQPGESVKGLIITRTFDKRLTYALLRKRGIRLWTYDWRLKFDKHPFPRELLRLGQAEETAISVDISAQSESQEMTGQSMGDIPNDNPTLITLLDEFEKTS